jgi:hypothetical protein
MRTSALLRFVSTVALILLLARGVHPAQAQEDTGWVITEFDATYEINSDGTVDATEDIRVDFGPLQKHGIFRDIPVEYAYDAENNRLIQLTNIEVDDGAKPHQTQISDNGRNLGIRIGDPDRLVTGQQRYRIRYTINRGLNPFSDHDEFYWNVTGNEWPVPIQRASAAVSVPDPGVQRITCYQGPTGSTQPCDFLDSSSASAKFNNGPLGSLDGLTIVVGLEKGLVVVEPPELVDANQNAGEQIADFLGLHPIVMAVSLVLLFALCVVLMRLWWEVGRDRWYGDSLLPGAAGVPEDQRPFLAHETIVTELTPPEVGGGTPRGLRPAEIGLLVDERADTLDVTATIVDLAVRKHLTITEQETGGILGLFKKKDYELTLIESAGGSLLAYEQKLLDSLFETGSPVKLSDLKNKFYDDLKEVKTQARRLRYDRPQVFPPKS